MTSFETVSEWAQNYRTAWETSDSDLAASLFSEDGTYRDDIFKDEPNRGRAGIVDYWAGVTSVQSDVTVLMGRPLVDGDRAVIEFWTTMRVDDAPVTLAGALLLDFNDEGLCASLREYYNFTDGFHEPPDGWGG